MLITLFRVLVKGKIDKNKPTFARFTTFKSTFWKSRDNSSFVSFKPNLGQITCNLFVTGEKYMDFFPVFL